MTEDELSNAVRAWAESVVPDLGEARKASQTQWPLPSAYVHLSETTGIPGPVQQRRQRAREVDLVVAVHPEPHDAAQEKLYGFMHTLMDGLEKDKTLGGRAHVPEVPGAPLFRCRYNAEVENLDDGSLALGAVLTFTTLDVVS